MPDYNKNRADEKRKVVAEYKVKQGCVDCGYNAHAAALEFDHLPNSGKIKSVASLMYASWDVIWAEIAKCEVVCSNCHSIRTHQRAVDNKNLAK
ncbi:HNH endonuclease [Streptomyces phage JimJam]|nr:HNH endonuclease [Streptomyces phage JimJam]